MKNGKRLFSILLTLVMLFSLVPGMGLTVHAEETLTIDDLVTAVGTSTFILDWGADAGWDEGAWRVHVVEGTLKNITPYYTDAAQTLEYNSSDGKYHLKFGEVDNDWYIVIDSDNYITDFMLDNGGTYVSYSGKSQYALNISAPIVPVAVAEVTIAPTSADLTVGGDPLTLTATVLPDDANPTVTWASSDENVATVDENGVVTAIAAGTATITATATNGTDAADDDKTATCTVTVKAAASAVDNTVTIKMWEQGYANDQMVGTITSGDVAVEPSQGSNSSYPPKYFNTGNAVRFYGGNTFTVSADGNTISKIVFTYGSDDKTNEITADTGSFDTDTWTGSADSVTFTIGGTTGHRRIASIAVTYAQSAPATVAVESVSLDKKSATLTVGGDPLTLTATVAPDDAAQTVTWVSSDESVATVNENGVVTAVGAGTATITVTSNADDTKSDSCTVTVTAASEPVVLIDFPASSDGITTVNTLSDSVYLDEIRIHNNADKVNGYKLGTQYSNGGYIKLEVDGGFQAGDVVTIAGAYNNTAEKDVTVTLFIYDESNQPVVLLNSAQLINGRTESGDPVPETYTLTEDVDALYVGRSNSGQVGYVTLLTVTRPGSSSQATSYSVIITAGDHMTKTTDSGDASQTDLSDAMTDVVYTADTGYKFPETSEAYTTTNGITVARTGDTVVTVSGTPTADTEITIPDAVEDAAGDVTRTFVDFAMEMYAIFEYDFATLPEGVTASGTQRNDKHGYGNVKITVPVDGPVRFTIGDCQYAKKDFTVTNQAGETVATLSFPHTGCYDSDATENAFQYVYTGGADTLTFDSIEYCSYFKAEAIDYVPVAGVNLSKSEATLTVGGDTLTLTANVLPDDATDQTVTWVSSDESVATVNENGVVTAIAAGTATITATSNADDTKSDSCTVTVEAETGEKEIIWNETTLATTYGSEGFLLTRIDTDGKHAVDMNTAAFGTAENYKIFTHRLKTNGKSGDKNSLKLTVGKAGILNVYVRTGSNSATDRNLVLKQGGTELYNQVVLESDAVNAEGLPNGVKVYPVISVEVQAGDIEITYPVNALNFYGFSFTSKSGDAADTAAAGAVSDTINALPAAADVALTDSAAIAAARAAYDALTDDQKAKVSAETLKKLTDAEAALAAAQTAADKDAADTAAAQGVTDTIDALPDADSVTLGDEAAIAAARAAYDSLTDDQQAKVSGETLKKLTDAEAALAAAKTTAFANYKAEKMTEVSGEAKADDSDASKKLIADAQAALEALTYDASKTLNENKAAADAILEQLDKDLAAQREADKRTVKFETNGGTAIPDQTITAGQKAAKPADPEKTGSAFDGWYQDATFSVPFDFDTPITADVTVYAKWTPTDYQLTSISGTTTDISHTWTKGSSDDVVITVKLSEPDHSFDHFVGVEIDGVALERDKDYTVKEGSTIVTLKAATVQKLSVGAHTVTILFDNGKVDTKLTVKAASGTGSGTAKSDSPKTGDESSVGLWIAVMTLCGFGLGGMILDDRKRRTVSKH